MTATREVSECEYPDLSYTAMSEPPSGSWGLWEEGQLSTEGPGCSWRAPCPAAGPQVEAASYLEEDVGAGAVEAVGPGIERGDKGASLQGAAPGTGLLRTLPVAPGAPAAGREA